MSNAYQPKVSLLEKLARDCRLSDPEIIEWYDRMAELGHVPKRDSQGRVVAAAYIIEPGTRVPALLLGADPDEIECGVVIAETPKPPPLSLE